MAFEVELASYAGRHATENAGVSRKRKRNSSQFVHAHASRERDGRHLSNLDGPLANNVAAQDLVGRTVSDQLAKTECASALCCRNARTL